MKQYLYELTWYPEGNEMTMKTNNARLLLNTLHGVITMGDKVEVIDGFTGELLCAQNCDNPYIQEGFSLMFLGSLMERNWG